MYKVQSKVLIESKEVIQSLIKGIEETWHTERLSKELKRAKNHIKILELNYHV